MKIYYLLALTYSVSLGTEPCLATNNLAVSSVAPGTGKRNNSHQVDKKLWQFQYVAMFTSNTYNDFWTDYKHNLIFKLLYSIDVAEPKLPKFHKTKH